MRHTDFASALCLGATIYFVTGCGGGSSEPMGDAGSTQDGAAKARVEPLADDALFRAPETTATAMSPLGLFGRTESASGSTAEIRLYIFGARLTYAKKCLFEGGISVIAAATVTVRVEHVLPTQLKATVLESNPKRTEVRANDKIYSCDVNPAGTFELYFNGKKMTEHKGKEFLDYEKLGDVLLPLVETSLFRKVWVAPNERALEPMRGMFVSLDSADPDYGETRFDFRPPAYNVERVCISRSGELFRSHARGTFVVKPERNFSGSVSFNSKSETSSERCPLPPYTEWTMYRQELPTDATYQPLSLGTAGGSGPVMYLAGK